MTDRWRFDASSRDVLVADRRVRLAEKPFRVLEALVEARGAVVTRADLQKRLWPADVFVDFDNNLNSAVTTLRQAFGDSGRAPKYIETIPKVGYRLLRMPIAVDVPVAPPAGAPREPALPRGPVPARFAAIAGAIAACVLLAGAVTHRWPATGPAAPVSRVPEAQAEFEQGAFLRARYFATHRDAAQLELARDAFRRAGARDATFAAATAEEADTLVELAFAGRVPFRDGLRDARALAKDALRRDRGNAAALRVAGLTTLFVDWDFDEAREWIDRASTVAPNDARAALARATWLAASGRAAEAAIEAERAVALDPASHFVRADLALFYLAAGRLEDAAGTSRRVLEAAPDFIPALAYAVLAHERLGRWETAAPSAIALLRATGAPDEIITRAERAATPVEAVRVWHEWDLARVQRAASEDANGDYALGLALRHAVLGDSAAAFAQLDRALAARSAMLVFLPSLPELAPLHDDPRFQAFRRSIHGS